MNKFDQEQSLEVAVSDEIDRIRNSFWISDDEGQVEVLSDGYNRGFMMREVLSLLRKIKNGVEDVFVFGVNKFTGKDVLVKKSILADSIPVFLSAMCLADGVSTYSPSVEALIDLAKSEKYGYIKGQTITGKGMLLATMKASDINEMKRFNNFVSDLHVHLNSQDFIRSVSSWVRANRYRNMKVEKLVNAWFSNDRGCARLCIIRIDLGISREYRRNVSLVKFQELINQFLNNTRGKKIIFRHLVGYLCKIEFTERKRFHAHFVFAFNGSLVCHDILVSRQIEEYWKKMTGQRGVAYCCNIKRNTYDEDGIGLINHDDDAKRQIFMRVVVGYLLKREGFCKVAVVDSGCSFRHSQMPKKRTSNAGRPRKSVGLG